MGFDSTFHSFNSLVLFGILACFPYQQAVSGETISQFDLASLESEENRDHEVSRLSLKELIEFAKKNNPVYQSAQQDVEVANADLVTAGLWPNPEFSFEQNFIGGVPASEAGSPEYAVALNFEVDVVGKRGKKKEVARKGVQVEKLNFSDFDRLFQFQLRQTYRQYLLLSEQVKFRKDFFENYMKLLNASKVRAEKGDISGIEYDRLDLERIGYEADYRATELQLIEVSQKMRRILGINPSQEALSLKGDLGFVSLQELELTPKKIDFAKRPDFAALISKSEQSESLASLRRREVLPSFNLGSEYRLKGNYGYFGIFISFPIPVWNWNQGEITRAEELAKKYKIEANLKKREIKTETQTRYRELLLREKMLLNYQELGLLEKNKRVAERARFAYLKKAYSIVALVESQRNYINVQKNYFDQVYLYYNALDSYLTATSEGIQD
jgi:cobalt-zinc-cadmium efflux system outer membrane protein